MGALYHFVKGLYMDKRDTSTSCCCCCFATVYHVAISDNPGFSLSHKHTIPSITKVLVIHERGAQI